MQELNQFKPHMDRYADSHGWEHPQAYARLLLPIKLETVLKNYPDITNPAILLGLAIIELELSALGNDIEDNTYRPTPDVPNTISETASWLSTEFVNHGATNHEYLTALSALVPELPAMRHFPTKTS